MPLALDPATLPTDDIVLPFQVDTVRGRLVRLGPAVDRILKQHAYPAVGAPEPRFSHPQKVLLLAS